MIAQDPETTGQSSRGRPTLTALHIYPVKSAGGISLRSHEVVERGFRFDRRWMLVGEDGAFRTQRELPRLSLVKVTLAHNGVPAEAAADQLLLTAPGQPSQLLPLEPSVSEDRTLVRVWKDTVAAWPGPDAVSAWFSQLLQEPLRLVYMPDTTRRGVSPAYARGDEVVSFADGFPFLLLSEGSLNALNEKLDQPVPMSRFRPNLVVAGCEPFAEDRWKRLRIGELLLDVVKPCPRCVMTTVDDRTGQTAKEPLATLATFRSRPGAGVLFGQNLVHRGVGRLQVGAPVEVLETSP